VVTPASRGRTGAGRHGYSKRFLRRFLRGRIGCLEEIPEAEERVLVLRTGIGAGPARTRRQVARMLHVSLRREGQLERRGVSGVRAAATHGCPSLEPGAARAVFAAASAASQIEQLAGAALGKPRRAHAGQRQTPHKRHQSVAGASTRIQQGAIPVPSHAGTSVLLWILLGAGLLAATAVAAPVARRRGRPRLAPASGAGAATAAPPATANEAVATAAPPATAHEAAATAAPPATAHEAAATVPAAEAAEVVAAGAAAAAASAKPLERPGDGEGALAAYRRADAAGDARGATNLGVLLEQRGDIEGALAAYRRADQRGDVNGAFNLGLLLAELGDSAGAMAALRRADVRGDPAGASNLGVLLERHGDIDGALAAYRRADERGDANGAFNLGLLLAARGDLSGARAAYGRAAERDDPEVRDRAHAALQELNGSPEL
jgi:tetratricopeptide (TPR) repeat protein